MAAITIIISNQDNDKLTDECTKHTAMLRLTRLIKEYSVLDALQFILDEGCEKFESLIRNLCESNNCSLYSVVQNNKNKSVNLRDVPYVEYICANQSSQDWRFLSLSTSLCIKQIIRLTHGAMQPKIMQCISDKSRFYIDVPKHLLLRGQISSITELCEYYESVDGGKLDYYRFYLYKQE